jgi:hypothetical protein
MKTLRPGYLFGNNPDMKKGVKQHEKKKCMTKKRKVPFMAIITPELTAKKTFPTKSLITPKNKPDSPTEKSHHINRPGTIDPITVGLEK